MLGMMMFSLNRLTRPFAFPALVSTLPHLALGHSTWLTLAVINANGIWTHVSRYPACQGKGMRLEIEPTGPYVLESLVCRYESPSTQQ